MVRPLALAAVVLCAAAPAGWGRPAAHRSAPAAAAGTPGAPPAADSPLVPPAVRRLLGRPALLGQMGGDLAPVAGRVLSRLRRRYGVDAGRIPVYIMTDRALSDLERRIARRDSPVSRLRGFEYRGVVYVGSGHLELEETLIHEVLHALSHRFSREAHRRGIGKLVEGTTQYLAMQTGVSHELEQRGFRRHGSAYGMYVRFAQHLATLVGDDVLARCYLGDGYDALARAVDRRLGRGALDRAARRLERDDMGGALAVLGPAARGPFDSIWLGR